MGMLDNLIAMRILYKLVTPFVDSDAYKLGIIDEKGKLLKKPSEFTTSEEKDAYDMLDRLVFNLKRLLSKLPGGDNKLKNLAAAYFLVKEHYDNEEVSDDMLQEQLETFSNVWLVEETLEVMKFLELMEEDGGVGVNNGGGMTSTAPVNRTGPEVSTDQPLINKKKPKLIKRKQITQAELVGI
jgi:hypothetical protein